MDTLTIRTVNKAENNVLSEVVNIHLATFKGFFLTFMGKGFLRHMYKAYTKHTKSDILVAIDNDKVVGFLAYSKQMSDLYKWMVKHQLIPFAWYSLCAFIRKPKVFMRLLRAFLKPGESRRTEKYVELASIGVHPAAKSKGIGSYLIDELKRQVDFDMFNYITLETDAIDNEVANLFYVKNGFRVVREYETREGRKMYEYRYEGEQLVENKETPVYLEYSVQG